MLKTYDVHLFIDLVHRADAHVAGLAPEAVHLDALAQTQGIGGPGVRYINDGPGDGVFDGLVDIEGWILSNLWLYALQMGWMTHDTGFLILIAMSRYRDWDLSCKVYVGNLGSSASKHDIESAFSKYGPLKNVWVARNPPGFAFVEYEDPRDAEDAVRGLDGT
uniref:RRM domain-containing protein n=1 Tax=Timema bartmani TaxID=61472 RepID=A0A7R9HWU2_9NEOP|nr:unnamed protein product [Timema bartmani]